MDPRLRPLLEHAPAWLEDGPDGDVAVASRVRLARNLRETAFPQQFADEDAAELVERAREVLGEDGETQFLDPADLSPAEGEFVVERSLASRDLLHGDRPALLAYRDAGLQGVMVNEEDHFRIQGLAPGMDLAQAMQRAQQLEHRLRKGFRFAWSEKHGYLTSCPTNTGTGLRASLLLHLPALSRARTPLQRALQTARSASLAVRGVHGEGSRALGHFYQISNQRTLGTSTADQLRAVAEYGREVSSYERQVRRSLVTDEEERARLAKEVTRALDVLAESDALNTAKALDALSVLRLGGLTGVGAEGRALPTPDAVLQQCFQLQPGHLQVHMGRAMDPEERDVARAEGLRRALGMAA